jgi:hypothetical protein
MKAIYVDECKQRPFLLAGFTIDIVEQHSLRKILRTLLLPGQRSLHFKAENGNRKKAILSDLRKAECSVLVIRCKTKSDVKARICALNTLIGSSSVSDCKSIVLELDETVRLRDHRFLKQQQVLASWDHRRRHEEPLLWVADAVAWCVNRGGEWERMVRPMILETIDC